MEVKSQKRMLQLPLKITAPVYIYTHLSIWCDNTKNAELAFSGRYTVAGDTKGWMETYMDKRYGLVTADWGKNSLNPVSIRWPMTWQTLCVSIFVEANDQLHVFVREIIHGPWRGQLMKHCYILTQLLHLFITKFTTRLVMHKLFSASQNCKKKSLTSHVCIRATQKREVAVHSNSAPDCTEYTNRECSKRHHFIKTSHYEGHRQLKLQT